MTDQAKRNTREGSEYLILSTTLGTLLPRDRNSFPLK